METNLDVVNMFQQAMIARDVDRMVACFADDGKCILASGPEPGSTHERSELPRVFREMLDAYTEAYKDFNATWTDPVIVDDGRVLVEFTMRDDEGKLVQRGVDIFEIRDGKIAVKDVFGKTR